MLCLIDAACWLACCLLLAACLLACSTFSMNRSQAPSTFVISLSFSFPLPLQTPSTLSIFSLASVLPSLSLYLALLFNFFFFPFYLFFFLFFSFSYYIWQSYKFTTDFSIKASRAKRSNSCVAPLAVFVLTDRDAAVIMSKKRRTAFDPFSMHDDLRNAY